MSWQYDHSMDLSSPPVDESSSADNKSPISYTSDMITMNDDFAMSKNSSLMKNPTSMKQKEDQDLDNSYQGKNSSPATTLAAATSTSPEENATASSVSSSNLTESSKQHQDREFSREPPTSQNNNNNNSSSTLNAYTNQQQSSNISLTDSSGSAATTMAPSRQSSSGLTSASIIDQLLPQSSQSALSWASAYSMPSIYTTFGIDMNYQTLGGERSLGVSGLASSSINDGLNLSGISNRTFQAMDETNIDAGNRGDNRLHFMDNFDNQMNTSDISSNLFSNESSFAPSQSKAADYQHHGDTIASNRTYSSVLHNPSQMGLSILQQHQDHLHHRQQQQQQQQTQKQPAGRLSLLDSRQQHQQVGSSDLLTNLSGQSSLISNDYSQSLTASSHRQNLNNTQARLLHDFISSANHQQPYSLAANRYQQANTGDSAGQHGGPSSYSTFQAKGPAASGRHSVSSSSTIQQRNTGDKIFSSSTSTTASNTAVKRRNKLPFFAAANLIGGGHHGGFKLDTYGSPIANSEGSERFSRKVFVGGLPPDIDEEEIKASFRRFGALIVDWPHKAESKSYFPPKGYAFLLFQEEASVQSLIDACFQEEDKLYLCVSSPTIKDKPVQIRPWRLSDTDFVLDSTLALDPRKTVFVGGVPRPLKASELAKIINNLYGGVCYAGIDTDPELKYPKGAGRVAFSNHQSYIAAISARFVHIQHSEIEKRVEVKPYVLDDQFCDECQGSRCGNKFAPFFCANITCLRYFCDNCWSTVHSQGGREFHKPLVKEGGDRPRGAQSFRW